MVPNKYHIVTGLTRSGSSCMMGALREAGIPIAGWKFPISVKFPDSNKEMVGGTDVCVEDDHVKKNPMGFWEVPKVVRGGLKENIYDGKLIKLPCESLLISRAKLIDRAIFMIRQPDAQINSLYKDVEHVYTFDTNDLYYMMAYRNVAGIKYLMQKHIPYLIVEFEEVLANPSIEMDKICKFLERGDADYGAKYINRELQRSKPLARPCKGRDLAMEVYKHLQVRDSHYFRNYNIKELKKIDAAAGKKSIERRRAAAHA